MKSTVIIALVIYAGMHFANASVDSLYLTISEINQEQKEQALESESRQRQSMNYYARFTQLAD